MNTIQRNNTGEGSLIDIIQMREQHIDATKMELLKMWIDQGSDLQKLQEEERCSQNHLSELTGISKGSVFNYIQLSKDKRILQLLETGHHGEHLVEDLNQKKLIKLTKLDDKAFDTFLETGSFPSLSTESNKETIIDIDVDDETSLDEQIIEKELLIQQLRTEVYTLKKQLPTHHTATTSKTVLQFTKEGVFLAEFPSISIAEMSTSMDKKTIDEICRNEGDLSGDFIWRFAAQDGTHEHTS